MTRPSIAAIINRSLLYWLFLPCLLVTTLLGLSSAFWMRAQLVESTNLAVETLGRHIGAYTEDASQNIAVFAVKTRNASPQELERLMAEFVEASSHIMRLIAIGQDGRIQISVPPGSKGNDFPLEMHEVAARSLILSRPFLSPASGKLVIYIGHRAPSGTTFVGELNLSQLQGHIQGLQPFGEGAIILADAYGNLISHPDDGAVRRQENIGNLHAFQASSNVPETIFHLDRGANHFDTTQRLPGTGWVLLVKTPAQVILWPILRSTLFLLLTVSAMLLFVSIRTRQVLRRRVVEPLERFTKSMAKVAEGDYEASGQVHPNTSSELAQAEEEFTAMARTIRAREAEIRESEGRFRQLVENVREVFWIQDLASESILYISPSFDHVFGTPREELYADPRAFLLRIIPEDLPIIALAHKRLRNLGQAFEEEYRIRKPDGSLAWIRTKAFPVYDSDGAITRVTGIAEDVTEAKRFQRSLQSIVHGTSATTGTDFFRSLVQTLAESLDVPHAIVAEYLDIPATRAKTLAFWSNGKHEADLEYDLAGTPCGEVSKQGYCYFPSNVQVDYPKDVFLAELNVTTYLGIPLVDSLGVSIGHLVVLAPSPIQDEPNARSIITIFSARAAAELERLRAERAVAKSLHEKEILLKEIHHRVKNNLQIISSLLNLQMVQVDDPVVVEMFQESRDRIRSIALVHEELYRYNDLAHIDVSTYVRTLVDKIMESHAKGHAIRIETEVDPVALPINAAVPMGLIMNELITNAFKHAFADREGGLIRIVFKELDGQYALSVADDGIGLPPGFSLDNAATLGMQLVVNLATQLRGELSLQGPPGSVFRIVFPAAQPL